jgi:hypothetical protein
MTDGGVASGLSVVVKTKLQVTQAIVIVELTVVA